MAPWPQNVGVPPGHFDAQAPAEQTSPVVQVVPQVPQLFGSIIVSAQAVPQTMEPPGQLTLHLPVEQIWPVGQALPQVPQ